MIKPMNENLKMEILNQIYDESLKESRYKFRHKAIIDVELYTEKGSVFAKSHNLSFTGCKLRLNNPECVYELSSEPILAKIVFNKRFSTLVKLNVVWTSENGVCGFKIATNNDHWNQLLNELTEIQSLTSK